jgi:tetratricopeptide (TPR) repeat protein
MSRWLPILTLFLALPAWADAPPAPLTVAGIAEFNSAYQAWDEKRFAAAEELFCKATTNAAPNVTNYYWLGVARFHRMLQLQNSPGSRTNKAAATSALDAAIEALTTAAKLDDNHAESHALLGTLYGMKIGDSTLRALRFGPRVAKHQARATKQGAGNPRAQYLFGMCEFHTANKAAEWRETLATLLAAERLFEAEAKVAPAPLEPRWGHSSCLTFIGRTYELLRQPKNAAEYFRKALTLHPADHLAREGLQRVNDGK